MRFHCTLVVSQVRSAYSAHAALTLSVRMDFWLAVVILYAKCSHTHSLFVSSSLLYGFLRSSSSSHCSTIHLASLLTHMEPATHQTKWHLSSTSSSLSLPFMFICDNILFINDRCNWTIKFILRRHHIWWQTSHGFHYRRQLVNSRNEIDVFVFRFSILICRNWKWNGILDWNYR